MNTHTPTPAEVINMAMIRAGYGNRQTEFCRKVGIPVATLTKRKREPWTMTIGEYRRLERILHFTENEQNIIFGRTKK